MLVHTKDWLSRHVSFLAQCASLSQSVLCVHEILGLLLHERPLDCHIKVELASYMTPLSLATTMTTKLSPNKYWPSCGILLPQMTLIRLSIFWLPWDNRKTKKNAIPRYWSSSCLTTSSLSHNKLSMSDCPGDPLVYLKTRIAASQWDFRGACIYWLRVQIENTVRPSNREVYQSSH